MSEIHRDNDSRSCGASTTVVGQSTVLANGVLISVQGDPNTHGGGALNADIGDGSVIIEGKPIVVVGSSASSDGICPIVGGAHCSPNSTSGSKDVSAY